MNRGCLPGLNPLNSQLRGEFQRAIWRKGLQPVAFSLCSFFACLLFPSMPLPDDSHRLCQIGHKMSRVSAIFPSFPGLDHGLQRTSSSNSSQENVAYAQSDTTSMTSRVQLRC